MCDVEIHGKSPPTCLLVFVKSKSASGARKLAAASFAQLGGVGAWLPWPSRNFAPIPPFGLAIIICPAVYKSNDVAKLPNSHNSHMWRYPKHESRSRFTTLRKCFGLNAHSLADKRVADTKLAKLVREGIEPHPGPPLRSTVFGLPLAMSRDFATCSTLLIT